MEIVGRLTADAKVSILKDERKVVNFSVAVNESYKPKGMELPVKITNYFNCSYWMNPAIAQHLTKGALVELYGRIGVNAWTNTEGEAKASLNFHVNNIKLHGKSNAAIKEKVSDTKPEETDDLPF
ncbi:MAG TPA: single-stranded DNA-binding protein [Hanamia sp.]|nr:single-stranded DNA-binding protein [Hanamia sp.]